ncbi:neprosin family prolyl endopeptidase [Nocardia sp. CA-119907]|uniref:neprosin family prolyl endopeptidase n=1 Tax=Nocardia sp. CA-119907 TaxID=3239973 RepID=UPI003D97C317
MYRTTLEQLSRFPNLAAFSTKGGAPGAATDPAFVTALQEGRYSTGEETVDCLGGASVINVWKPFALPNYQSSFSQQWYSAKTSSLMQTVECGWHVDPGRYSGNFDPHLFTYATRNTYENPGIDSVYNEHGGVFRKVDNPYTSPGAPLLSSLIDGSQIAYKMGFYLTGGKWWFYFEDHAIGYYPVAWFNNGPLSTRAQVGEFGGEVARFTPSGWTEMGSGRHASNGFGKAAYQNKAFLHYASGGAFQANLSVTGSNSPCYSLQITNHSVSPDWGTYLFFGGPGGSSC